MTRRRGAASSRRRVSLAETFQRALGAVARDTRHALRALRSVPVFTTTALLTLAIGIGATTVMFTLVDHIVLRPLAYRDVSRLVVVRETIGEIAKMYPSIPANAGHFLIWQRECTACADVAAARARNVTLTGLGDPERLGAVRVSANLFPMLGAHAEIGRLFTSADDDPGHERTAVLSDRLWRSHFGAEPSVLGRAITLSGETYTVVGVLPADFYFPKRAELGDFTELPAQVDLFVPLALTAEERQTPGGFDYAVIARLAPGATVALARQQLSAIQKRIAESSPHPADLGVLVTPLQTQVVGPASRGLLLLLGAVAAVLLIVCVNLANLLLSWSASRRRESAVRVALGASRTRLVRQALTEGVVLAMLGGALGIALAEWGLRLLVRAAPSDLPRLSEVQLDWRILLAATACSVLTGLAFGILPALRFSQVDPGDVLKGVSRTMSDGRDAGRMRATLVASQVALSTVLLVATGLLLTSFVRVLHVDKGFDESRALALDVVLPPASYPDGGRALQFYDRATRELSALPGVRAVAIANALPLEGETEINQMVREHETLPESERPVANVRVVTPNYFATLGVAVRRGRVFSEADRGRDVIMISEAAARRLWPNEDPLGHRLSVTDEGRLAEVIGVVADVRTSSLESDPTYSVYLPTWQRPATSATLVVRTSVPPPTVLPSVRAALRASDPAVPISRVRTLRQVVAAAVSHRFFQMVLLSLFALTAVIIGSVGIYGVVAHALERRTREVGVRLALGARPSDIHRLVLASGLAPVAIGLGIGALVSLALGRVLASLLFGFRATDPLALDAVAGLVLLTVAIVACWIPTRRVVARGLEGIVRGE